VGRARYGRDSGMIGCKVQVCTFGARGDCAQGMVMANDSGLSVDMELNVSSGGCTPSPAHIFIINYILSPLIYGRRQRNVQLPSRDN